MSTKLRGLLQELSRTQTSLVGTRGKGRDNDSKDQKQASRLQDKKHKLVQEILEILQRFPCCLSDPYDGYSPLGHLLMADAGLKSVKTACGIQPRLSKYLKKMRENSQPMAHLACQFCSEEVILFLAKFKPNLKLFSETYCVSPFVCALQNDNHLVSKDTLRVILEHSPAQDVTKNNALLFALERNLDLDLLDFMVDRWPSAQKIYDDTRYSSLQAITATPSVDQTQIFCRLWPKLEFLRTTLVQWNTTNFVPFLQALETNQSILNLQLQLEPHLLNNFEDEELLQAFQNAVSKNDTLESFLLEINGGIGDQHPWINELLVGVQRNASLTSFRILRNGSNHLFSTRDKRGWNLSLTEWETTHQTNCQRFGVFANNLRRLELLKVSRSRRWWSNSRNPYQTEFTDGLVAAIRNQGLEELEIRGYEHSEIDTSAVFKALRTNSTLRVFTTYLVFGGTKEREREISMCLDLLTNGNNVTLRSCWPWFALDRRIEYYLTLNRYERGRKDCSFREWVRTLLNVQNTRQDYFRFGNEFRKCIDSQIILYGLLRERPGWWCHRRSNAAVSRKRKAHLFLEVDQTAMRENG